MWEKTAVGSTFGVTELAMPPCGPEPHMDVTGGCGAELLLALRSVTPSTHLEEDSFCCLYVVMLPSGGGMESWSHCAGKSRFRIKWNR